MGISNSFVVGRTLRVPPIEFVAQRIVDILFVIYVLASCSTYRGCGAVVGQSGVAGTATVGNTVVSTGTHNGADGDAIRTLTRVVHTRYGKMQGVVKTAAVRYASKKVDVFLGVPYATPPTGANRFSPTRALTPWDGVRVFDEFGAVCPQWLPDIANETAALERMPKGRLLHLKRLLPFLRNQSEDCLYLNIYAPSSGNKFESEAKYPVIVFFHGESFSWNAGNAYDGHILASYTDSIVVTFNYRLGVLGFLNVNAEPYQKARVANYGLMDQIAALDWIRQNIGHFDGDAKNITLLGHGTGAACINFLMVSPAAMPGLFHRVILLSGSALSSWALIEEPIVYSLEIARQMNCTTDDADIRNYEHIVDCLREVPLAALMNAKIVAPTFLNAFGPNVDGVVIKTNFQEEIAANVLPDMQTYGGGAKGSGTNGQHRSSKIARESKSANAINANKYDLLFGCVTAEALWRFSHEDLQSGFEGDRRDRILRTYIRNTYNYHLSEIFFTVVNEYTDWERTVLHPINTRDSTVAALSDAQFVAPLVQMGDLFGRSAASLHPSSNGNSMIPRSTKAFFYVFDYQTKDADYPLRMGTAHGEDLPYIFGAPLTDSLSHFPNNFTKPEVTLSEALMIYIGNFARTGDPNDYQKQDSALPVSKERNRFRTAVWEEYDPVHQKYLEISMKPKMKNHFRAHQLSVWLRLIPELHRAGMEDVTLRHNTFHTAHDNNIYDGILRNDRYGVSSNTRRSYVSSHGNGTAAEVIQSITTVEPYLTTCVNAPAVEKTAGVADRANLTYAVVAATNEPYSLATYSTTLSLTIAIGCTLLVLNVLIFAGVYYQRDKTRMEIKTLREQQRRQQVNGGGGGGGDTGAGDSPYGVKSVPRGGYQSAGSIMLDLEPTVTMTGDGGSMLYNTVAGTLPRAASGGDHHVYKYHAANLQATLPRHLQSSKSTHITRNDVLGGGGGGGGGGLRSGDDMTTYIDCKTPIVFEEPYPGASANGSIVMHPVASSVLPKPPPPPKSSPPLQPQPLLHGGGGGHTSTTPHQKCGILKVPTAAMNEMRV